MVPEPPEIYQCGYSAKFNKFICINTESGKRIDRNLASPIMEGAQCLSREDYSKSEAWVAAVIEEAKKRCK